jgi:FAD/FMN-containing dehydrogenase
MFTIEGNWEETANSPNLDWARETEQLLRGLDDAGAEGAYAGFTGVEEQEWEDWSEQVYGDNYDRLAAVKAEYDPDNVFSLNVNIDPADRDD